MLERLRYNLASAQPNVKLPPEKGVYLLKHVRTMLQEHLRRGDSSQFHSNSSLAPLDRSGRVWCLYWVKFKGTERSQVAFWSQATCHILHVLVTLVELNFCPWQPKKSRFRQWEHLKDCSSSPPIWCSRSFCNWHVAEKASCNLQSTFKTSKVVPYVSLLVLHRGPPSRAKQV